MAPFEVSRPPPSIAAQISKSAIRSHGWRGSRSVSSTRRRLMKLAREKFTEFEGERMDVDQLDSSSALSGYRNISCTRANNSVARNRAHPYARYNPPMTSPFVKDIQLHGLPLASPFHEKQLELPSSPSPPPCRNGTRTGVRECHW